MMLKFPSLLAAIAAGLILAAPVGPAVAQGDPVAEDTKAPKQDSDAPKQDAGAATEDAEAKDGAEAGDEDAGAAEGGTAAATKDGDASDSGIWGVSCGRDLTGIKTGCSVTQTVVNRDTGRRLVTVSVRRTPDGAEPTVLLTLPLRTFLIPGAMIQVDEHPGRQSPFQLCDDNGCYVGLPADESLIDEFKSGTTLAVEAYDTKRQKIQIKLPLKSFADAFDKAGG